MGVDPYIVQLDADTKTTLKMYLLKDVQNVEVIRNNIIKGVWNCAVIKPNLIADPFQVAVAANMAAVSEHLGSMVTRTVFAEILFNLSMTKNISKSLSKFGIETDKNMLICFLVNADNDNSKEILSQIEGELCPISDLKNYTVLKEIQSEYKIDIKKSEKELLDLVVSRIATKNIIPLK